MRLLVDGDIVAYRCAASVQDHEPLELATYRIDELLRQIVHNTDADSSTIFLSGSNNFRYKIYPEYKANRVDMKRPAHLAACKQYLTSEYSAITPDIWEADDLLGYHQSDDTIIASIDKDLLMVPGNHHNWVKGINRYVTPFDGLIHFYKQMLIGDRSDNIIGVKGIGEVKAERLLGPQETEQALFDLVYDLYQDPERFATNASCLWINQGEEEQSWVMHTLKAHLTLPEELLPKLDQLSKFMKSLTEDISTGHGMNLQETYGILPNGLGKEIMQTDTPQL